MASLLCCMGVVKAAVTDVPEMSTDGSIKWYTISNTRSASGKYLYWTETGVKDANTLTGAALFYFTAGVGDTCFIHNAATELLFTGEGAWNEEGVGCVITETPHSSKAGVAIQFNGTALNEQNFADGFTTWSANDEGSIFVISPATASIEEAIAKIEENKEAGNTIMGQYKYEEESYNGLTAALATLQSATGEEAIAAFENCVQVISNLPVVMPEEGKFYVIEAPLFAQVQGVSKGLNSTPGWNTIDLTDTNYYWTVEVNNGTYALKNVATGTYLGGTAMSETAVYATLTYLGEQQFNIVVNGTTVHANGHGGGASASGNIVTWAGGANSASAWAFIEKNDPASLQEAVVTYNFTYGDEVKYTQTTSTIIGEEWPAITVAFPYGVSASKPEGVVEAEKPAPTTFYIKNAVSGKYLDYDPESNLTTEDDEAVATIVPSSVVAGTFAISYPNPKAAAGVSYVQCGSKGRFSGNTNLTLNSSVYLYKVTDEGTATRVEAVEDGASYVFVAECSKTDYEGYWMLTNEPYGEGTELRMIGVKVSDELADEITYEQGEYSPVWTVSVAEVEEVEAAEFYVKNAVSGKYLNYNPESNLTTGDAEAVATIVPSSLIEGTFAVSYPDPDGQTGVRFVQSGSSGRFSGNASLTTNSSIYVYKVANESTATRVEAIEDGASYIFVAESSKGGYWMLTNEPYGSDKDLRMVGMKVSDELPGDEITYEQGEYSPVWTIEAVEKEKEAIAFTKEIALTVGELPFVAAADAESIETWYYVQMHSNQKKYIQYLADQPYIEWADAQLEETAKDSCAWAFVGNIFDGFKVVNKAATTEKALQSTGSGDATMVAYAEATQFVLAATNQTSEAAQGGFCLRHPEQNQYLNAQNGKVAHWSSNDAGSTFLLEEYVEEEAVTEVTLNTTWAELMELNATLQLEATINPADATDKTITWTSSAEFVTVDENGLVTVVAPGQGMVEIKATAANGVSASCWLMVEVFEPGAVQWIQLNKTWSELMGIGAELQLEVVTIEPDDATDKTITWSSNAEFVEVDENGLVTVVAAGEGMVTITATAASGVTATCMLSVTALEVSLNTTWGELNEVGATLQLVATVTPEDTYDKTVTWTSSNEELVTVDANGLVTVVAAGMETVEIKATAADGSSVSCWLTVYVIEPGAVTELALNATYKELTVKQGETFQLVATVNEDATDKTITWSSNASEVATVDETGLVTFVGEPCTEEPVLITATASNGMQATCYLIVTIEEKVTDGIKGISADGNAVIYDIHGRRVTEMTKGIYIVNGKKVIVK